MIIPRTIENIDERISNLRNKVMQNAITLKKKIKNGTLFKFKPFSLKQKKILTWWTDESPVKDKNGIIAGQEKHYVCPYLLHYGQCADLMAKTLLWQVKL